jgi:TRAP-type C4-dicarboxylate transport system permease large subunit
MTITVFLLSLCGAMALGMPIAFALMVCGVALMGFMGATGGAVAFDSQILAQNVVNGADSFVLMAVPFFMLAGELMNAGGLSKRIVLMAGTLVGHVKGGLGYVAIMAAVVMASLSGSAVADTAALAALLIPMMKSAGYNVPRACGLIASGGIIAPVIPPSIGFVVFGVASGVSITKLFMAGIMPGVMMGLALAVTWWWVTRKDEMVASPRAPIKDIMKVGYAFVAASAVAYLAFFQLNWYTAVLALVILGFAAKYADGAFALLLPMIIVFGLKNGVFTPTEAAVVVAVYALLVGAFIYRDLTMPIIYQCLVNAAKMTAVIMFLVAAALVSAWLITVSDIASDIKVLAQPFMDSPRLLMFILMLIVVMVGTALDFTPTVLILTPVLMPIVKEAGINPVYFGVLFILNNAIGLLTPPVGTVLNVVAGVAKQPMDAVIKGVWPFLISQLVLLILFILFPDLVLIPMKWFSP